MRAMNLYASHREKLTTNKALGDQKALERSGLADDGLDVEDESPVAQVQKFTDATDEMSAVITQFRNRRDYEKRMGTQGETNFERILDEDVLPKVDVLLKAINNPGTKSLPQLLLLLRSLFPDDSDLVLVLRELIAKEKLSNVTRKRLEQLLKQVEAEAPQKQLKAGINIALRARLSAKKLGLRPSILRSSYRRFQETDDEAAEIYFEWVSLYGSQRRHIVLEFMEGSLLTDIDALDPSCSAIEFGYLLSRLWKIKQIRSAENIFISALIADERIRNNSNEDDWLIFILGIIQQPISLDEHLLEVMGDDFVVMSYAERSILMNIIYRAFKKLSPDFFNQPEDYEVLLDQFKCINEKAYMKEKVEQRRKD